MLRITLAKTAAVVSIALGSTLLIPTVAAATPATAAVNSQAVATTSQVVTITTPGITPTDFIWGS